MKILTKLSLALSAITVVLSVVIAVTNILSLNRSRNTIK